MSTETLPVRKPIPYGRQHITPHDVAAVVEALQSDFLTQGPAVEDFERAFARYTGSRFAVAAANGTAALHLSALALGVGPGTRVITTPVTFAATANCVLYCGGEVTFADIDPETGLLSYSAVEALLSSKPRGYYSGIIPVDLAGLPVNLEQFRKLADAHGLWIIEDACHAPGGRFTDSLGNEHKCGDGSLAELSVFSFHPVKHIATAEGGMVTTNSKALYEKLQLLRTHGITRDPQLLHQNPGGWHYEMQELGYNYRMPDLLAALGTSQLSRAAEGLARRRKIAARYDAAFRDSGSIKILNPAASQQYSGYSYRHAYHLYIILAESRKELYDHLRSRSIFAQVHYIPLHTMPYYSQLGWKAGDFPHAESYYSRCLSLPMFPGLTDEEQEYVIAEVLAFFSGNR